MDVHEGGFSPSHSITPFRTLSPSCSLGCCKYLDVFLHHKTMVIPQIYYIYCLNPFKVDEGDMTC